jgi:hypothetical protein
MKYRGEACQACGGTCVEDPAGFAMIPCSVCSKDKPDTPAQRIGPKAKIFRLLERIRAASLMPDEALEDMAEIELHLSSLREHQETGA